MHGNSRCENREIPRSPEEDGANGTRRKGQGRTTPTNDPGKSHRPVVPTKPPNKAGKPTAAEAVEGRGPAKENVSQRNTYRTQSRVRVPSELEGVRQAARRNKGEKLTALFHHLTLERLRQAYEELNKKAAAGVDGVTWEQYGAKLEENLQELHQRLHRGAYRAKPSRRVYIPKADGQQRPLGVAALEDKLVQRAVVEILNAIYEGDFLGFSYGARPGRGAHEALDALATAIRWKKVSFVLDADIRGFYEAINHEWMLKFVEHRIADKRVVRLIQKWLSAGVMENGIWTESEEGTPQGATISSLLSNLYLHYVLDLWVQQWRKRTARGEVIITRYVDDFIVGFQYRADADRFLRELRERLQQFSLELHPDKTRLIAFGRFAVNNRRQAGRGAPETFNFLGFTHICGTSREGGFWVQRRTMQKRMTAKLHELKGELQRRRHQPIPEQGRWLQQVVRGYFGYHGVPGNEKRLRAFRDQIKRLWLRALRRRGQRDKMSWKRMERLEDRWLPPVRWYHPWPDDRFGARIQGKNRMWQHPPSGSVRGAARTPTC
jgi:group II intron reverse transcriptase/maturase